MKEFDEMHENVEKSNLKSKLADIGIQIITFVIAFIPLFFILAGGLYGIISVSEIIGEQRRYNSKASVSAGIITDKEIINGHTESDARIGYGYYYENKSYVPTVYRIHISAEFEYDGETHQGSNYFDVSEDVYNSYNVGDYFDSKDLKDSSE